MKICHLSLQSLLPLLLLRIGGSHAQCAIPLERHDENADGFLNYNEYNALVLTAAPRLYCVDDSGNDSIQDWARLAFEDAVHMSHNYGSDVVAVFDKIPIQTSSTIYQDALCRSIAATLDKVPKCLPRVGGPPESGIASILPTSHDHRDSLDGVSPRMGTDHAVRRRRYLHVANAEHWSKHIVDEASAIDAFDESANTARMQASRSHTRRTTLAVTRSNSQLTDTTAAVSSLMGDNGKAALVDGTRAKKGYIGSRNTHPAEEFSMVESMKSFRRVRRSRVHREQLETVRPLNLTETAVVVNVTNSTVGGADSESAGYQSGTSHEHTIVTVFGGLAALVGVVVVLFAILFATAQFLKPRRIRAGATAKEIIDGGSCRTDDSSSVSVDEVDQSDYANALDEHPYKVKQRKQLELSQARTNQAGTIINSKAVQRRQPVSSRKTTSSTLAVISEDEEVGQGLDTVVSPSQGFSSLYSVIAALEIIHGKGDHHGQSGRLSTSPFSCLSASSTTSSDASPVLIFADATEAYCRGSVESDNTCPTQLNLLNSRSRRRIVHVDITSDPAAWDEFDRQSSLSIEEEGERWRAQFCEILGRDVPIAMSGERKIRVQI